MFAHTANSIIGIAHARCGQQPCVVCDSWERSLVHYYVEGNNFVRWRLLENENSMFQRWRKGKTFACMAFLSPKKETRNTKGLYYIYAKFSDGKKCARLVSFDIAHRDAIKKAQEDQSVVAISNSIVKKSSVSSELEVHINQCLGLCRLLVSCGLEILLCRHWAVL